MPDDQNKHPSLGAPAHPGTYVDGLAAPDDRVTWYEMNISALAGAKSVAHGFCARLGESFRRMLLCMVEGLVERDCLPFMLESDIAFLEELKTLAKADNDKLFPSLGWDVLIGADRASLLTMLDARVPLADFWKPMVADILRRYFSEATVRREVTVEDSDEGLTWTDAVTIGPFQTEQLVPNDLAARSEKLKGDVENWTFYPAKYVSCDVSRGAEFEDVKVVDGLWGTADTNCGDEDDEATTILSKAAGFSGKGHENAVVAGLFRQIAPDGMAIAVNTASDVAREDLYWGLRGRDAAERDSMLWRIYRDDAHRNPWTRAGSAQQFAEFYGNGVSWVTPRRSQGALGFAQMMLGAMAASSAVFPWHVRAKHRRYTFERVDEVSYVGGTWGVMSLPDAEPTVTDVMEDDIHLARSRVFGGGTPRVGATGWLTIYFYDSPIAEGGTNELLKSDTECASIWDDWTAGEKCVYGEKTVYSCSGQRVSVTPYIATDDPIRFTQTLTWDTIDDLDEDVEVYVQDQWPAVSWAGDIGTPGCAHCLRYEDRMPLYRPDGETIGRAGEYDTDDPLRYSMHWQDYKDGWRSPLKATIAGLDLPDPTMDETYFAEFDTGALDEWIKTVGAVTSMVDWYAVYVRDDAYATTVNGTKYYYPCEIRQIVGGESGSVSEAVYVEGGVHYSVPATATVTEDPPDAADCYSAKEFSESYAVTHGDNIGSVKWGFRTVNGVQA